MSAGRPAIVALIAVVLLAGCAGRTGGGEAADRQQPSRSGGPGDPLGEDADPTALIGLWSVEEATEDEGTVLRIASDGLSLWRRGSVLTGTWRADPDALFVAILYGSTGRPADGPLTPAWLTRAARFRVEGDARVLLDGQGGVVARLSPGGRPVLHPDVAKSEAEPPVVTSEARRDLAAAAPLPAGLTAPGADGLLRRWVPAEGGSGAPERPHVVFREDGTWRGSDGCNAEGGRWVVGNDGAFLVVSGPTTLIGCDGVPVGSWLVDTRRVGLDGDALVLLDAQGDEVGRMEPGE